ncbi:MAG: PAS domain-containing protein [Candidatus Eremiobacteraeota bacterium]|nr:PAS domain-containing protein [Candidatus Eremiobacteraeota bacterium]
MKDSGKTKKRLIEELEELRKELVRLRATRQQPGMAIDEEFIINLMHFAPLSMYITSSDNRYLVVNREWEKRTGVAKEEALGKKIDQLFPPPVAGRIICVNNKVKNKGVPQSQELSIDGDGGKKYYLTVKFPLRSDSGRVKAVGTISLDITDRKLEEKALKERENAFRRLLESLQEGIIITDGRGVILFVNAGMAEMIGYTIEELTGKDLAVIIARQEVDVCWPGSRCGSRESGERQYVEFIKKDGGLVHAIVNASPVLDEEGACRGLIAGVLDFTERRKLEKEREDLITDLKMALAEIKTLSGILPICMHCKKIHNDNGSWERLEQYICRRTDAEFSHGICPECAESLYPEIFARRKSG